MILRRQPTDYSCGPAAIAAAATLQGHDCSLTALIHELKPDPVCGTENDDLFAMASKHLALSEDQSKWHGGLAIANIRNPDSGVGHYVVMLDVRGDIIRYYCPLNGKVISIARQDLVWTNGSGSLHNWVINLCPSANALEISDISGEPFVFILGDSLESLSPETDTSLLLMSAYKEQGVPVFWVLDTAIALIGDVLYLNGLPVGEKDLVWIRFDPVNTVRYYEILRLLAQVKNVTFLNSPSAILLLHDKLASSKYRKQSLVISATSKDEVKRGLRHIDWRCSVTEGYVIKSPSRFGGQNMRRAKTHDEAISAFAEFVQDSGYVLIEPFLRQIDRPIDKRVFVANGRIVGAVDRVAAEGDWRCNIHAGASVRESVYLPGIASALASQISDEGIFCAGLDFMGDELTEINVSCPSAIPQINLTSDVRAELMLIDEAWRWTSAY